VTRNVEPLTVEWGEEDPALRVPSERFAGQMRGSGEKDDWFRGSSNYECWHARDKGDGVSTKGLDVAEILAGLRISRNGPRQESRNPNNS